jgi:hypothetical protein
MTLEEFDRKIQNTEAELRDLHRQRERAKETQEKKYKVGMRFVRRNPCSTYNIIREQWIFVQIREGEVALISTESGNRWYDPKAGKAFDVSVKEFIDLFGEGWEVV